MIEEPALLTVNDNRKRPTAAQIAAFQGVPTSFVADAMHGRGALAREIGPIGEGRDLDRVAAGPALTADNQPADILATLGALHYLQEGDILVAGFAGHQGCAAAGDRVAGMVRNCGAVGFVTDGPMRDYHGIVAAGLPCWCTGLTPASPFTKGPARIGTPITIGGQRVETGDMVVADRDGVVIVPFAQIDAVIEALEHVRAAEAGLDAEVVAGLRVPQAIIDLLDSDQTRHDG